MVICALPLSWSQRYGASFVGNNIFRGNILRAGRGQGTWGFLMRRIVAQPKSNWSEFRL